MKYCSAIEKNEILPFATTWMDFIDIKTNMISLVCGILNKPTQAHRYREQIGD